MNSLHKIMVIGAGLGLHGQIAALFPEQKPEKALTEQDKIALQKADAKRQRRAQRNQRAAGE
nr:hypothetical protein [Pseudomonas sp. P818]